MNNESHTTKFNGNNVSKSKFCSKNGSQSTSTLQTDFTKSLNITNTQNVIQSNYWQPKLISERQKFINGGRGITIQNMTSNDNPRSVISMKHQNHINGTSCRIPCTANTANTNINRSSQVSKLKNNPFLNSISQSCDMFQSNNVPKLIPDQIKCGGRGMVIKKISESIQTLDTKLKNPNMSYSNINIESHFKKLRKENKKKLTEENEKKFEKYFSYENN